MPLVTASFRPPLRTLATVVAKAALVVGSGYAVVAAVQSAGLSAAGEALLIGAAAAGAALVGHTALDRLERAGAASRADRWETTLTERFGTAFGTDAAAALSAAGTARGDDADPVALTLVVAAKHGIAFDAVAEWGVESGVASADRFEAERRRLVAQGMIADDDRPADRLELCDDRLAEADGPQLASITATLAG
jgi:hypothetical protein